MIISLNINGFPGAVCQIIFYTNSPDIYINDKIENYFSFPGINWHLLTPPGFLKP